jgi:hypothetical protein
MTVGAVQAMRRRGNGPPFVKLGAKRVRCRLSDIVAFEQSFTRLSETRAGSPEAEAKAAKQRDTFKRLRPNPISALDRPPATPSIGSPFGCYGPREQAAAEQKMRDK